MSFALISAAALFAAVPQQQPAPSASPTTLTAIAVRADHAPNLDGRADDAVWQSAKKFWEFRQFEPRVDAEPSFRTEFQVAYDEKHPNRARSLNELQL